MSFWGGCNSVYNSVLLDVCAKFFGLQGRKQSPSIKGSWEGLPRAPLELPGPSRVIGVSASSLGREDGRGRVLGDLQTGRTECAQAQGNERACCIEFWKGENNPRRPGHEHMVEKVGERPLERTCGRKPRGPFMLPTSLFGSDPITFFFFKLTGQLGFSTKVTCFELDLNLRVTPF